MCHRSRNGGGLILVGIGLPATCRWGDGGIHDVSTWESRIRPWAGWGTRPMCPNTLECSSNGHIVFRNDPNTNMKGHDIYAIGFQNTILENNVIGGWDISASGTALKVRSQNYGKHISSIGHQVELIGQLVICF